MGNLCGKRGSSASAPQPVPNSSEAQPVPGPSAAGPVPSPSHTGPVLSPSAAESVVNTSSQRNLSTRLPEVVQKLQASQVNVTKFKAILTLIDKALEKHEKHSKVNLEVPDFISGNLEDAETTLDEIYDFCSETDLKGGLAIELQKILSDAFGGLATLHWIMAAFSVVAFVLKRTDTTRENKESCLTILRQVRDLGYHLVDFFDMMPQEEKLRETAASVVEVSIVCISQLDQSYLRRFTFTKVTMGTMTSLQDRIEHIYRDLGLTVQKESLRRISPVQQSYDPTSDAVGREEMVDEILEVIQQKPQACQAILLHGIGGIGKTTICNRVISKINSDHPKRFASIAHVEIGDIGDDPGNTAILERQSRILEILRGQKETIQNAADGEKLLREHFTKHSETPILIFVDNIFGEDHLTKLLPTRLVLPRNSFILATSRNARVCQASRIGGLQWRTFPVDDLKEPDARILLDRYLGGCPDDKHEQFDEVLGICNGWPLAIRLVGSHLNADKEDDSMWMEAITRLRECKSVDADAQNELSRIVRWSYEQVDDDAKRVFLDVACLLKNRNWSWIEALGITESRTLEARSLVKRRVMLDPEEEDEIEVHDLLVALAQQESHGAHVYSYDGSLPSEGEYKDVQGLVLSEHSRPDKRLAENLDAMSNNLRILLEAPEVQGECKKIPRGLQILTGDCPYMSLQGLTDLRVLEQSVIFRLTLPQINFGNQILPKALRVFKLNGVDDLESFHEKAFDNCKSLQTLHIANCRSLKELPAGICGLRMVRVLSLVDNHKLRSLPSGLKDMRSLQHFRWELNSLEEFPSKIKYLTNLVTVSIRGVHSLPESLIFLQLSRLKHLGLVFSADSKAALETGKWQLGVGKLYALKSLRIEDSVSITGIRDDFSGLTGLEKLSFSGCIWLTQLPEGLQYLCSLSRLNLEGCEGFQSLPDAVCQLSSLRELNLGSCVSLKQLPEGFHKLVALAHLDLKGCSGLQSLPDAVCQLSSLRELNLGSCVSLKQLPEGFHKLVALAHLNLEGCSGLQSLPTTFFQLPSLETLWLTGCTSLREVPGGFENLRRLTHLSMVNMAAFEGFPDGFPKLTSLRFLSISAQLFQSIGSSPLRLESLRTLELNDCETLTTLPMGFTSLTSLEEVSLKACQSLIAFPAGCGNLVNLRSMVLDSCKLLEELPGDIEQLTSLQKLHLYNCVSLTELPSGFGNLLNLQDLCLRQCRSLESLPDNMGGLHVLQSLKLTGCHQLQELPDSICELKFLSELTVGGNLKKLPGDVGKLTALEYLNIRDCPRLEALPESMLDLKSLYSVHFARHSHFKQTELVKQLQAQNGVEAFFS